MCVYIEPTATVANEWSLYISNIIRADRSAYMNFTEKH